MCVYNVYVVHNVVRGTVLHIFTQFHPLAPEHPRHENFFDQKLTIFFLNFFRSRNFQQRKNTSSRG